MSKPWVNNMLDVTANSVYVNKDMDMVKNYIERYGESSYEQGRADVLMPYDVESIEELIENVKSKAKADAIDECIKVMKYCWYNGQQPLKVLIARLEQLKEQKND